MTNVTTSSEVKFSGLTYEESGHMITIWNRVVVLCKEQDFKVNKAALDMDIIACHSNGCPLDFKKLAEFPQFDFNHDIVGILNHMNRLTGKLEHCFLPRCSK